MVPRAFIILYPIPGDFNAAIYVLTNDDLLVMADLRKEDPGVRCKEFSKFLALPSTRASLETVVVIARPLAKLSLIIMKHDPVRFRSEPPKSVPTSRAVYSRRRRKPRAAKAKPTPAAASRRKSRTAKLRVDIQRKFRLRGKQAPQVTVAGPNSIPAAAAGSVPGQSDRKCLLKEFVHGKILRDVCRELKKYGDGSGMEPTTGIMNGLKPWQPSDAEINGDLVPPAGTIARTRGVAMGMHGSMKWRMRDYYDNWPMRVFRITLSEDDDVHEVDLFCPDHLEQAVEFPLVVGEAVVDELYDEDLCCLDNFGCKRIRLNNSKEQVKSADFRDGLDTTAENLGETVSTTEEEQLHGLMAQLILPQ